MAKGHKRLMQQNCIETLQSDRESLIQELSLLVVGRDCRDSVAQSIQKFHSRFVDWAQGFQCYRLNKIGSWQRRIFGQFSWRGHLSCCARWRVMPTPVCRSQQALSPLSRPMWGTGPVAMGSLSSHQGVCHHCEKDRWVPSPPGFWLMQTLAW